MKKTISINISGILFHIEEDGYSTLKKYLDSINKYFSTYSDNQEIIADIENRIAEIFLSNLKNNKQVITEENINALIEKMGTIADFKAAESDVKADFSHNEGQEEQDFYKYITPPNSNTKGYKKLTRLENRKILGGVCAGIAHYLAIDALWIRLIAILLLFSGKLNFNPDWDFMPWNMKIGFSIGIWALLAYIVMWVMLPASYDEPEDKNIKKLYRNPDDRTLGGVASGVAAYFGIEVIWARLIFVALIFAGGSGLVIYIILWIITPQASSITERIQMKGGAITLDNIDYTIKENMNIGHAEEESPGKKVLLAPFRVLGKLINNLGTALGPIGLFILAIFRILFGTFVFLLGLAFIITPVSLLGVYFAILPEAMLNTGSVDVPIEWIIEMIPAWLAVAVAALIAIPGIIILLLAISVFVKRNIISSKYGLILLGLWIISLGVSVFQLPKVLKNFSTEITHQESSVIDPTGKILVLKGNDEFEKNAILESVTLQIKGGSQNDVSLIMEYKGRGKNIEDATLNAKAIQYEYLVQDSTITFPTHWNLSNLRQFRAQKLRMTLEVPYERAFIMHPSLTPIIRNTLYQNGYKIRDLSDDNYFVFNERGLLCLTCNSNGRLHSTDSISVANFKKQYPFIQLD
ncbi:PspC domain-containing protein [Mongoliitalea daihaiensis]|uniref:PspC domain-containing protein n=1 Tax=Mongoliitalea daihaiensis TaxID=2782006 RepID=UPI001F2B528F|nr:PspC domain-containing protein [Mongoliitalea daihaiensis]UJP65013.1 PspC domain-containing protein [Mongoliitalea daihaiensis]